MNQGHTTDFVFDGADFFVAHLDNGGARFGFKGVGYLQAPAGHPTYAQILSVTPETAEAFFDAQVEAGNITLN